MNTRPTGYEPGALAVLSYGPSTPDYSILRSHLRIFRFNNQAINPFSKLINQKCQSGAYLKSSLYYHHIDNFIVEYARNLKPKDLVTKDEDYSSNRKGKRQYLSDTKTSDFTRKLNAFFRISVDIPKIIRGEKQEIETLINEEALLLAKYLRKEKGNWRPRIATLDLTH